MKAKWVGSWRLTINLPALNASSLGLSTFFEDGNLIASEIPMLQESAAHGSWAAHGDEQGEYAFIFFIGSPEAAKWQEGRVNGGVVYARATDAWSGPFTIQMTDQDGTITFDQSGTITATRIGSRL